MTGHLAALRWGWMVLCLPLAANALSIAFEGSVDVVVDPEGRLDGSVVVGIPVSGIYTVDPTPSGGAAGEVGPARLVFTIGNYVFDVSEDPHQIDLLDDTGPEISPVDIWRAAFLASQLTPAVSLAVDEIGLGGKLELFDFQAEKLDGSGTPFVPLDLAGWENPRLTLEAWRDAAGDDIGGLQIEVGLDAWNVVPEPASAALLAGGLATLATRRRPAR